MLTEKYGKAVKGLGGLYSIRIEENGKADYLSCKAKGSLHRDEEKLLIGDRVRVTIDDSTPDGVVISEILPRKNSLIRPPMANLDYIFSVFAAAKPAPVTETVDKLIAIAEYNGITPVAIITKADLDENKAQELRKIYSEAGFDAFIASTKTGEGIDEIKAYIEEKITDGITAAFAGASGVGKSTLMNRLFPDLSLATAEISRKIERGRHTTRHVELFALSDGEGAGFLADTPGFSLLDFSRFDFFPIESLASTFREISGYVGKCRYADCSHVGEGQDDCAVIRAVFDGRISESRHNSYKEIYKVLKAKKSYD